MQHLAAQNDRFAQEDLPMSEPVQAEKASIAAPRRERGGRMARREARSGGPTAVGRPYIVRNIPPYDVMGEENLVRIEKTADRILAEVGIAFRDDPVAIDHWKRAGADVKDDLVKFEPGMLREILKSAPGEFTQIARNPANNVRIGGKQCRVCAVLWLSVRHGSRQWPPLRHDRGLRELRQTGTIVSLAASFRRHDLRAGRRAGQQTPSRHGLCPYPLLRPAVHGFGNGGRTGGRFHRDVPDPVRRRNRREQLRRHRQLQC